MTSAKDKRVFVTGGTGLLGSYLLRYLIQQGYTQVVALKRKNSPLQLVQAIESRVQWVEGDILDISSLEEAMQNVQLVYHCAAKVSFQPADRKALMETNRVGTENVVNTAHYVGVEKLLHVSSTAAIGREKHVQQLSEKHKWMPGQPYTSYSLSKYLAEQEAWRAYAEGLPVVIVNPSMILGSGYWDKGPQRFFGQIWKGLSFYPNGGNAFVDVRDVARFMILLMESDVVGERYIVSSENESFKSFFDRIAQVLHKEPPGTLLRPPWDQLFWRLEKIRTLFSQQPPFITRETVQLATATYQYDNHKSIKDFQFSYVPLQRTIAEIGQQFLAAMQAGGIPKTLPLI